MPWDVDDMNVTSSLLLLFTVYRSSLICLVILLLLCFNLCAFLYSVEK